MVVVSLRRIVSGDDGGARPRLPHVRGRKGVVQSRDRDDENVRARHIGVRFVTRRDAVPEARVCQPNRRRRIIKIHLRARVAVQQNHRRSSRDRGGGDGGGTEQPTSVTTPARANRSIHGAS